MGQLDRCVMSQMSVKIVFGLSVSFADLLMNTLTCLQYINIDGVHF